MENALRSLHVVEIVVSQILDTRVTFIQYFIRRDERVCRHAMNQYVKKHSRRSVKCLIQLNSEQRVQRLRRATSVASQASKIGSVSPSDIYNL